MPITPYFDSTADGTLTGGVNATNTDFTPSASPDANSIFAWINDTPIGCSLVSGKIRLTSAPLTGDTVYVRYLGVPYATGDAPDSAKWGSALNIGLPWAITLCAPTDTPGASERQWMAHLYAGLFPGSSSDGYAYVYLWQRTA